MKAFVVRTVSLLVLACLAGAAHAAPIYPIDDATCIGIIAAVKQKIAEEYVFPDKAKLIAEWISDKEARGVYRGMNDLDHWARP